jgi:hypothetical protein
MLKLGKVYQCRNNKYKARMYQYEAGFCNFDVLRGEVYMNSGLCFYVRYNSSTGKCLDIFDNVMESECPLKDLDIDMFITFEQATSILESL